MHHKAAETGCEFVGFTTVTHVSTLIVTWGTDESSATWQTYVCREPVFVPIEKGKIG